jgi:putative nucleotidyltransferase with HDIG domain
VDRGLTAREAYNPFGGYASRVVGITRAFSAEIRTGIWAVVLLLGASGSAVTFWLAGYRLPPLWAIAILGLVAALAERQSVAITERTSMSVSFLPLVFAAVVFGPLGGFAVGVLSNTWDIRESRLKWSVYTPIRGLTAATAGWAAWALVPHAETFGRFLLASLVASVADLLFDGFFNACTAVVRGVRVQEVLRTVGALFLLTVPLYVPVLALFVYGYHAYSLRVVLVFFIPALAAQRLLHLYQEEKVASRRLAAANDRLRSANFSFATGLVAMLEARDRYTAGHSEWVARYSEDIARRMGLSVEDQEFVRLCGLVHDLGKIRLPAALLEKPGALTLDERRQMEKHSEYGELILTKVEDYSEIARIVRHHHERIDGNGYPDRLVGEAIPLVSRIIAVADAYNAMTSDRPYREKLPSRVARLRLAQAVETQFDTGVVAAFEAILASAPESYRMGQGDAFGPGLGDATLSAREELPVAAAAGVAFG